FLGPRPAEAPPTSFTIGIAEPGLRAERRPAAKAAGFDVRKVKRGHGDEVAILDAIRRVFDGVIRVDPNAAWTAEEAPGRIERIAPFGLEFVEQPVAPQDIEGLRHVREHSSVPIVADEAAVRIADVDRL